MNLNQIVNLIVRTVIMQTTRLLVNRMFGLFSRRGLPNRAPVQAPSPEIAQDTSAAPAAVPGNPSVALADPVAEARRQRREAALARRNAG